MLVELAVLTLIVSVLSFRELERREARLRAGAPGWRDLARITGLANPRDLLRLPGVSLGRDGHPRFNPAQRTRLPAHRIGLLLEHRVGHGISISLAILALGAALSMLPAGVLVWLFLAGAAAYQLLCRLYALTIWVEYRTAM